MSSLWNQTAAELLEATASRQPTPGGGSVAALSGAFGVGLLHMALSISQHKAQKAGGDLSESAHHSLEALSELQTQLRDLADDDVKVFERYMAALKLPKDSEEDKKTRQQALKDAGAAARQTPLAIAQRCLEALQHAQNTVSATDNGVMSDVGAGAALLRGAADAALLTLDINIVNLKEPQKSEWQSQRTALANEIAALSDAVIRQVQQKILITL